MKSPIKCLLLLKILKIVFPGKNKTTLFAPNLQCDLERYYFYLYVGCDKNIKCMTN